MFLLMESPRSEDGIDITVFDLKRLKRLQGMIVPSMLTICKRDRSAPLNIDLL